MITMLSASLSEASFLFFGALAPISILKMQIDASFRDYFYFAGAGWVCRDHEGWFIKAGGVRLTSSSALMSEALALKVALEAARSDG